MLKYFTANETKNLDWYIGGFVYSNNNPYSYDGQSVQRFLSGMRSADLINVENWG